MPAEYLRYKGALVRINTAKSEPYLMSTLNNRREASASSLQKIELMDFGVRTNAIQTQKEYENIRKTPPPATSDKVGEIRDFAKEVSQDGDATQLQKDLANYILNQNPYSLKYTGKLRYRALFAIRTLAPNNYENQLAKQKLAIAFQALRNLRQYPAESKAIKNIVKQQCISAIYAARSSVALGGTVTYSCKAANSLEKVFKISEEVDKCVSDRIEAVLYRSTSRRPISK